MTQRDRTLMMLQRAGSGGVTTAAFLEAYIPRFSARIEELRREGFQIDRVRLRQGSFRYTLLGSPDLDGLSDPLRPVESGAGGALGVSASPAPALFDAAPAPVSPPEPVPHWRQDAA